MALPDPAIPSADKPTNLAWHAEAADAVARHLKVDAGSGLSSDEAASRLLKHGPNQLTAVPGRPAWKRFADQLIQPLVLVLIGAGIVTAGLGEVVDSSVIFAVVLLNASIGYWQEAKAEGALAALARSVATPVTVCRGSQHQQMDASQLEKVAILRVSGVASSGALAIRSAMRPVSVASPVAMTRPQPCPATTVAPA